MAVGLTTLVSSTQIFVKFEKTKLQKKLQNKINVIYFAVIYFIKIILACLCVGITRVWDQVMSSSHNW